MNKPKDIKKKIISQINQEEDEDVLFSVLTILTCLNKRRNEAKLWWSEANDIH